VRPISVIYLRKTSLAPERLLQLQGFVDLVVKGVMAVAVAVAGFHFKDINTKISNLETHDAEKAVKIAVTEATVTGMKLQMERIEGKLDRILEIAKKVQ